MNDRILRLKSNNINSYRRETIKLQHEREIVLFTIAQNCYQNICPLQLRQKHRLFYQKSNIQKSKTHDLS